MQNLKFMLIISMDFFLLVRRVKICQHEIQQTQCNS